MQRTGKRLEPDYANTRILTWVNEVTNAHQHGTTGAVPWERFQIKQSYLQSIASPYSGRQVLQPAPAFSPAVVTFQHDLRYMKN